MDVEEEIASLEVVGTIIILAGVGIKQIYSWTKSCIATRRYNRVRENKQATVQTAKEHWMTQVKAQIQPEDANRIVSLSFENLRKALHSGEVTATQALHAYQYKVVQENTKSNFLCEAVVEAEDMAAKLDALSAKERQKLPLFGIPISLKEIYMLEGYDCTVGCVRLVDKPMKETSSIVKLYDIVMDWSTHPTPRSSRRPRRPSEYSPS